LAILGNSNDKNVQQRKEDEMELNKRNRKCKKLDKWLNGMSLHEKMKTLEYGKNITCVYCGLTVFDKEAPEDRIFRRCKLGHDFVENGNYIILSRCFSGLKGVVFYREPVTAEEAIIDYFKRKRH